MMMPFCTATPNRAMKPTAVATLRVSPVTSSAISPPSAASGTMPEHQQGLAQLAEFGEQQHHHQPEHQAEDQHRAAPAPARWFSNWPPTFEAVLAVSNCTVRAISACTSAR